MFGLSRRKQEKLKAQSEADFQEYEHFRTLYNLLERSYENMGPRDAYDAIRALNHLYDNSANGQGFLDVSTEKLTNRIYKRMENHWHAEAIDKLNNQSGKPTEKPKLRLTVDIYSDFDDDIPF